MNQGLFRSSKAARAAGARAGMRSPRPIGQQRGRLQVEPLEPRFAPALLVATSFFDSAVYEFNANSGALVNTLVAPYSSSLLSGPSGVTVGPDGNLYISSQYNDSILQYNLSTNSLSTFISAAVLDPIAATVGAPSFAPSGLRFGPDGNLYVNLNGGQGSAVGAVVRFDISSTSSGLAFTGTDAIVTTDGLVQPTGLTFGPAGDATTLYVSSSGTDTVVKITGATTASASATTFITGGGADSGDLDYPSGLAWGPDGNFYVVDLGATSFQGNVLQFDAAGTFKQVYAQPDGNGDGSLLYQFPSDLVFDSQGRLDVANLGPAYPPTLAGSIDQYDATGFYDTTLVSSDQFPDTGTGTSGISPSELALTIAPTKTTLVDDGPNASIVGQTVTFTVTVSPAPFNGETVQIEDASNGDAVVGSGTLTNGTATIAVSSLAAGTHNLFTVYGGDDAYSGSESGLVTQVVEAGIWNNFNGNAQHTGISTVAAQPTDQILWQTSLDQQGTYFWHTGEPVFTPNDTVIVPIILSTGDTFELEAFNGATGAILWTATSGYIQPSYSWLPPYQPVYDPVTNRVYFAGPGGTLYYISNPDHPGSTTPTPSQVAFFGTANYTANESAYNNSIFIDTPLTVDNAGNVYFGFEETGSNLSGIGDGGIGRVSATGAGTYVTAGAAVGSGSGAPAIGSAPAVSNDGSIVYVAINDSAGPYLVGVNAATLAPEYAVELSVPNSNTGVELISESTAAPMVAPDGSVFMGVFADNYDGSRGFMTHYSANLATEYTPGAFGWDDTASIIPTSMVPSYTGSSPYLILTKYNNYVAAETGSSGGNGVNEIAVLDPYATETDPNNDPNPNMLVMKQVLTITSPTEDSGYIDNGYPDATREWCTNGTAIDPATDSVFLNNEDGYSYRWNLASDTITQAVEISNGYGEPYTPTTIGPNGVVYAINGGTLFALGGTSNYTLTNVSSLTPAVVGQAVTFTTTLASTDGGAVPTGSITYSYTSGVNTPQNSTPITLGTVSLVNGQASFTTSALVPDHYHIIATYSGDATDGYAAGSTTLVQVVLANPTTTVTSSAPTITAGQSVTFTATVNPEGVFFVPLGTVSFLDGTTLLGTVALNPLDQSTAPSSSQTATFTTSSLPEGHDTITAVYSGDLNFATSTSSPLTQVVLIPTTTALTDNGPNPSVATQTVNFSVQVSGGSPTGLVQLEDTSNGNVVVGSGTLTNGSVSISINTLTVGSHNLIAVYGGDANNAGSVSSTVTQTVNPNPITISSVNIDAGTAPVISASESGSTVTITTDGPHGFSAGDPVVLAGIGGGYDGTYTILAVPTTATFTINFGSTTGLATVSDAGTATDTTLTDSGLLVNGTAGSGHSASYNSQRSMVDSIVYTFNQAVMIGAGGFTIAVHTGDSDGGTAPTLAWSSADGGTTWVVTFSGAGVVGNSIANGVYDITLNSSAVTAVSGGGTLASNETDTFYRLYGDVNGDERVNSTDYNAFNPAYNSRSTGSTADDFVAAFDVNDDGRVNSTDYNAFNPDYNLRYTGFTRTI